MIWREDARDSLRAIFGYDELHRLDFTKYPGETPDIDHDYEFDHLQAITRTTPAGTLVTRRILTYEPGGDHSDL